MTSYPTPEFTRPALAPGLLGAIVLLAGLALLDNSEGFFWIKTATSILALILCVFAWQARRRWWLVGLIPIAVLWNPVLPFDLHGQGWAAAQFIAALIFVIAGVRIRMRNPEYRERKTP